MLYRNVKTGALVESASIVSGGDWVEESTQEEMQKAAAQTKRR